LRVIIAKEIHEETTVVFDGRVGRTGKAIRVKPVAIWLVVFLVAQVVNQ
jgi:hypothetical protein